MKIGFILRRLNTLDDKATGVWGDEIICNALVKSLNKLGHNAKNYTPETLEPLDIAIYTCYEQPVQKELAKNNYLWIQGFNYGANGNVIPLDVLYEAVRGEYDGVFTASTVLAKLKNIPFLPPCVDFEYYHPVELDPRYAHDISFIGNNIKSAETNRKYLSLMSGYNYGLYGGDYGKVDHETALKIICSSKINLHYGFEEGIKWDMVTGRPFFHSACDAFTMSDCLSFFKNIFSGLMMFCDDELPTNFDIHYYLGNEDLRKELAIRARYITKEKFSNDVIAKELLNIL